MTPWQPAVALVVAALATSCAQTATAPTAADRPVPGATPAGVGSVTSAAPTPTRATAPSASATPRAAVHPLYPLPAAPAYPRPCPPPPRPPGPPPPPPPHPKVKTSALPSVLPVPARKVDLRAISGKGMWLTTWQDTHVDVATVVARAKASHLRQLWVRTGGTKQGFYGHHVLDALLPAAHAAGVAVVAWDFPALSDPVADAGRAARTVTATYGGQRLDGFSPDIETINEGTFNASTRVRVYLSRVRLAAGNLPVVATVMRPTSYQLRTYPYRAEAPYVDVFAPMVYWSCNEPGVLALQSYRALAKLRPVHLVGQSYDMADEGGRPGLPTGREIWRFLDVAKRAGAIGASLYLYSETRRPQWTALADYPWR